MQIKEPGAAFLPTGNFESGELGIIEGAVKAAESHELLVGALFRNGSVEDDEDRIRVLNRRKTVSDHKAGAALHKLGHGFLYFYFSAGVNV